MRDLHHSCQGESHILAAKVCQDASYSTTHDGMSIAIVSDGHGGARYFRSDVGSKFAVRATRDCIEAFVRVVDEALLRGKPFTQKQAITSEAQAQVLTKDTATDKAFRQLFSSIIYTWRTKIEQHAAEHPLTDDERAKVSPQYQDEFAQGQGIEKTYGCTLMCYVCTPHYWFAFHIGDGKCISFDVEGQWSEPIPWDERCFLNRTTSLCDSMAIDEFRYCYCGDGTHPLAVCLGSDGIDDSFGKTENMVNFYIQLLKLIANEGLERAQQNMVETLPQLSRIGSKDDMSVACVFDDERLHESLHSLIHWQKHEVSDAIYVLNCRIIDLREKLAKYAEQEPTAQKDLIDCEYARKSLTKAFTEKKALVNKWNKFCEELFKDDFVPYDQWCNDQIGFGEETVAETEEEKAEEVVEAEEQPVEAPKVVPEKEEEDAKVIEEAEDIVPQKTEESKDEEEKID